ncbi:MAG: hypothetical protein HYW22_02595 [Candidatus Aenigmarchaeota archaeon]|nr:hypothetical protein [Candidatus Aenigmarchaeota archaeon]
MAEEHQKRSHFKMVLAILLLLGIFGLLVYSGSGKNFSGFAIGNFIDSQRTNSGQPQPFGIILTTEASALYGRSFNVDNSSFSAEGTCTSIRVNDLKIEMGDAACMIVSDSFTGTFTYSESGSVIFSGTAGSITLNSDKFSSTSLVNIQVEVVPKDFSVIGVTTKNLNLTANSGNIQKIGKDGSVKTISYLSNTVLDISNLVGRVELSTGELKVTGTATSVKGDDFNW